MGSRNFVLPQVAKLGSDRYSGAMAGLKLHIEKVVAGGKGLARLDGRVVFVEGVLPGETAEVGAVRWKKDFGEADLVRIHDPHPGRCEPPCVHYRTCGGCDLQYAPQELQAELKTGIIRDSWNRLARLPMPSMDVIAGKAWMYRNRMQLHQGPSGALGLRAKRSSDIVAIPFCKVAHEGLGPLLAGGQRVGGNARTCVLSVPENAGTNRVFIEGRDRQGRCRVLDRELAFSVEGFFQSNLEVLEKLALWIRDRLPAQGRSLLLDLYGGVGTFSVLLGDLFEASIVVEEHPGACAMARENTGSMRARVWQGTVASWYDSEPDVPANLTLLVDPPREGLDKASLAWCGQVKPPVIVYVSCNPVTQARDAAVLESHGYDFVHFGLFDFYPQTWHMETCLIAVRKGL